jgi:hypothetical protein
MMAADSDPGALLTEHVPVLRYDSQEPYYADSAAEWTDNPGNVLRDKDQALLAAATPTGDEPQLSLAFLGATAYAAGPAQPAGTDWIGDPSHDYPTQARALHAQPRYADRVYGHWATGGDGRIWLAYWFFYFYNDYDLIGTLIKAGLHEGDWEMIQLRLDPQGQTPDLAVYAQHTHAGSKPWSAVEKVGSRPVVYPARGSHASYFSPGTKWTGAWFDHADGQRPGPELALEVIADGDDAYGWVTWPGRWGGTTPPPGNVDPLNDSSPRGPGCHDQYTQPEVLQGNADAHAAHLAAQPAPAAPPPPAVTASAAGADLQLRYDARVENPAGLVVTVSDPGGGPPTIHHVEVASPAGEVTIPGAAPADGQTVHVSVATTDKIGSPAAEA